MAVAESRFICGLGCYPVCPYCKLTLDREYQHFCDRCGQELDWKDYSNAIIIFPQSVMKRSEGSCSKKWGSF